MTVHHLKCEPMYYGDVVSGIKTFEIRLDDRNYQVGDYLLLRPWANGHYWSDMYFLCKVTYIMKENTGAPRFMQPGMVCMAISPILDNYEIAKVVSELQETYDADV